MIKIKPSPMDYGFSFPYFREYQQEAIESIANSKFSNVIVPAPTGSGKSLVAAILGEHLKTRAITHTRNLIAQYEKIGATAVYGMSHYPCVLVDNFNCDACLFAGNMADCNMSGSCHYLHAKSAALHSEFSACSYAYYFRGKIRQNFTNILYLDEAHYLPDLLMQEYEMTIKPSLAEKFDTKPFELKSNLSDEMNTKLFYRWSKDFSTNIFIHLTRLTNGFSNDDPGLAIRIKNTQGLLQKIEAIQSGIESMPNLFLVHNVDNDAVRVTPLSSNPFFKPFFNIKDNEERVYTEKIVLTSATIGSEVMFSKLLGIDNYDFIEVPNRFSHTEMPVYTFEDSPKLSYKSGFNAYKKQREILKREMINFFGDRAGQISGLLHFASKADTWKCLKLLNEDPFFRGRCFIHDEELSTEGKVEQWEQRMKQQPNTIALSWCFHTGLDAPDVDMNVIMKVPFPQIDEKQKIMFQRNPLYYRWKTANTLEQAAGRTRRGEPEHYEVAGEPTRKLVMILDNNYTRCINATSRHFQNCITRLNRE